MLNFLFGSKPECPELRYVVKQLSLANDKMKAMAVSTGKVGHSLLAMVQSEAPAFAMFFEKIKEIYMSLSVNYQTAVVEQSRAIEDLNDIIVRYPVFQKIQQDRDIAKQKYDAVVKRYKDAKMAVKSNDNPENIVNFQNCRLERAAVAAILLEKSEIYLSYRTKFNQFVQNRTKSAWRRYGASIERTAKVEGELMSQLAQLCIRLRDNVNAPQKVIDATEEAVRLTKDDSIEIDKFDVTPLEEEEEEEEEVREQEINFDNW